MKCLMKYPWVKLPRDRVPDDKGIMGSWMRLAARAAFRKGEGHYCGHSNPVEPGMWVGGIVGLKAILGIKRRNAALEALRKLEQLGFLSWSLDPSTKRLSYTLSDWLVRFSGAECPDGVVYTTEGYGFVCVSRDITQRLVDRNYIFEDADALLDLWCHTTVNDPGNAFSISAPAVQYGKYGVILTLETLGRRWGWEKTKVWRFFQAHGDVFTLRRLPGSLGCLIFNLGYPCDTEVLAPATEEISALLGELRLLGRAAQFDRTTMNRIIAWYSRHTGIVNRPKPRVALPNNIYRAYLSPLEAGSRYRYDCGGVNIGLPPGSPNIEPIRGPTGFASQGQRHTVPGARLLAVVSAILTIVSLKSGRIPSKTLSNLTKKLTAQIAHQNRVSLPQFGSQRRTYSVENLQSENEKALLAQADMILRLLTKRGLLPDTSISDEARRESLRKRQKDSYHNTELLLKNYRNIAWMAECFPEAVAEELEQPFTNVDSLLNGMEIASTFGDRKLEYRTAAMTHTRLLLDRINDALTVLKKKPENGQKLYDLLYLTYISPMKLLHQELLYRLDLSTRQYYRFKREAMMVVSLRLWSASDPIVDLLLDLLQALQPKSEKDP